MKNKFKLTISVILSIIIAVTAACVSEMTAAAVNFSGNNISTNLVLSSVKTSVTPKTTGLTNTGGLRRGSKTLSEVLGLDYNYYLKWLESHDKDNYYIGTPYMPFDHRNPTGDCTLPYGHLDKAKEKGMNCTGFIWHILYKSCPGGKFKGNHNGGRCEYYTKTGVKLPSMSDSDNYTWYSLYNLYDIKRYYFSSKSAMLKSGVLSKGDIIWMYVGNGETTISNYHHTGIYYGDGTSDRFWHSAPPKNAITEIKGMGNVTVYCVIKVTDNVASIKLNRNTASRGIGDTYQLKADISPKNVSTSLTWTSSNSNVVRVDKNGKITPKKVGTAVITVKTHNGKTAKCTVRVKNAPKSVKLNTNKLTKGVGDTYQLKATITKNTLTTLKWSSSNSRIVSVNSKGKITPKKVGTAVITVKTHNGKTAKCTVTVKNAPKSVKLNTNKLTKGVGDTYQLKATITKNTLTTLKWSSSNSRIVSVNSKGKITPKKVGTAVITVKTHNGKTAKCTVRIKNAPKTVKLNRTTATRGVGDTYQLKATITKNTLTTLRWSSSNSRIVSVNSKGKITPKKVGTAVITVKTHNGKTAKCKVKVMRAPDKVVLSKTFLSLKVGGASKIKATIPKNSMSGLSWSSNHKSIADVDNNGMITAKSNGIAVIKVRTYNGKTASCTVAVGTNLDIPAAKTSAGYKAVSIYTRGVNSKSGLKRGTNGLLSVLGIDKNIYLKWLDNHDSNSKNSNYYIGTPYSPAGPNGGDYRTPCGDLVRYGHASLYNSSYGNCKTNGAMVCTGFVWHVLYSSAKQSGGHFTGCGCCGRKNCQYITASGAMIPDMRSYSKGAYNISAGGSSDWKHPALWYDFLRQYNIQRYYFSDKQKMLSSGVLEKGDIILQYITGNESIINGQNHVGIFYGNNSGDDKLWHSLYLTKNYKVVQNGNKITNIRCSGGNSVLYVVLKL